MLDEPSRGTKKAASSSACLLPSFSLLLALYPEASGCPRQWSICGGGVCASPVPLGAWGREQAER